MPRRASRLCGWESGTGVPVSATKMDVAARVRVGITDIIAVVVVLLVVVLELIGRNRPVHHLYIVDEPGGGVRVHDVALASDIGRLEAHLAVHPEDGDAVEQLAYRLSKAGQTDWALREVGAIAASPEPRPERWKALLALSGIHAERIDIPHAYEQAQAAFTECDAERNRAAERGTMANQSACPDYERVRLQVYVAELEAGLDAIRH